MNKAIDKYNYLSYPENLPLEVNGNSKKRKTPIKRQQYNGQRASINEDSRALLISKMSNNVHQLQNFKSILPTDGDRIKDRRKSIKVFKNDQEGKSSGVEYLMQKTEGQKYTNHLQKAHIGQFLPIDIKRPERKHYQNQEIMNYSVQIKRPKNHKQSCEIRVANDIHSNAYRVEKQPNPSKKIESLGLFKNGQELGLQNKKNKKVSQSKLAQLAGNENPMNKNCLKDRRQDWRISNINFF